MGKEFGGRYTIGAGMDSSEKGIISQNLRTLTLILLCMGIVIYWVPSSSIWNTEERSRQTDVKLTLKSKELHQILSQIDMLKEHDLPLVFTDNPKEMALSIISEFKHKHHYDAYRVWLNPNSFAIVDIFSLVYNTS